MIITELSEGIQFFLKFLESVKKKLLILAAIFLIAAVVAYPVTDYVISDAIERSLPHNVKNDDVTDYFDQLLVVFDGPFNVSDLDKDLLLNDIDKKMMIYTEPVPVADAGDVVQNVITANIQSVPITDIIADYILRNNNTTFGMIVDTLMGSNKKGTLTYEELEGNSQIFIFQTIPYDEELFENAKGNGNESINQIGLEFEAVTGQAPKFMIIHLEKDEKTTRDAMVVYTKPLEVPLLKLKMSIIIAAIVTLPFLFYIGGKEIGKYVDLKKYKIKEKIPVKSIWLIVIAVAMIISFIAGMISSYFFMAPLFIQFLYLSAAASGAQATYSIYEFVSFIGMLTLIFGLIFEFPIVIFILNRLGLVQKRMLTKYRRHTYVLFFIIGAAITPPDVFSQIIVAVPMIFFFEISIILIRLFGKKDRALK